MRASGKAKNQGLILQKACMPGFFEKCNFTRSRCRLLANSAVSGPKKVSADQAG